ncbi:MAG: class I SAM-dependent methyltransferase [Fluviibacter sp.]
MPVRTHANKVRSLDAWSEYLSINPKLPNCHSAQHLNERDSITDQIVRLKTMPNSDPAATIFLKSWQVYQKIIASNYMFHREITQAVKYSLDCFKPDQTLRLLDLGCGDASMVLPLLTANRIERYIGCDLSIAALNIAKASLEAKQIPQDLLCEDMRITVKEQPDHSCDLVFSSYALHHLEAPDKGQIIREIARVLKPGGKFVLIDIFREPTETRSDYITHYMAKLNNTWINLTAIEQALVVNHATTYDFPETPDFYEGLSKKSNFMQSQRLTKHTWHEAWIYQR